MKLTEAKHMAHKSHLVYCAFCHSKLLIKHWTGLYWISQSSTTTATTTTMFGFRVTGLLF